MERTVRADGLRKRADRHVVLVHEAGSSRVVCSARRMATDSLETPKAFRWPELAWVVLAEHRDLTAPTAEDPLHAAIVARHLDGFRCRREDLDAIGLDQQLPVCRWQFRQWQQ